jgi:SAM-dependent methyltransferase
VVGIDRLASRLAVGSRVARRLGLSNLRLESGRIEALPPGPFDAIVIVDVLLYRPLADQAAIIRACRERLRPGGRLLIKEQLREPSWKARCVDVQERLVVGFKVGRERGGPWAEMAPSGTHLWSRDGVMELLRDCGLAATIEPLHAGSYLSHHLVIGAAPVRPVPIAETPVAAAETAAA